LKVCNILAILLLLYGYGDGTQKERDIRRPKKAEMKFMRRRAEYSLLQHRRNEDILELKPKTVKKKFIQYKQNWIYQCQQDGRG
jgi:hypothetical protein